METWKLKYSYAGEREHALIYTINHGEHELVKEIHTPKKYGKFGNQTEIFYEAKQKPVFKTFDELLDYLKILRVIKTNE